ncbi:MAG: MoaD/ThiS family protein [Rhodocyclales bacterium]|nr:MoaD/ThiS family protein [Rhodocyclales bacterium]
MKIKLKLYATLRDYLPAESGGKEAMLELPDAATIPDALAALAVPVGLAHIVMINCRHVLRADVAGRRLMDGDQLAVFPAIGGG